MYKLIRSRGGCRNHIDLFYLETVSAKMNYCKYRLILDIFEELWLITAAPDGSSIEMKAVRKVDLEQSEILRGLRRGMSAGA